MFHKEELKQVLAKSNLIRGTYFDNDYPYQDNIEEVDDLSTIPACAVTHLAWNIEPRGVSECIVDSETEGGLRDTINDDEYLVRTMIACVRDYYNVNDLQIRILQYANDWMGGYNGDLLFVVHKAVDYIDEHDEWLRILTSKIVKNPGRKVVRVVGDLSETFAHFDEYLKAAVREETLRRSLMDGNEE